jgi:DNA-binding LacI/PurR family transcriptional regulator
VLKCTIRDIAAAAGVSRQTVSRVLNDRPDVARQTRERVWQVIEESGYQPSDIARSLARRHTLTLGVVIAGLEYVGPSRTLIGVARQAERIRYTLLFKDLPGFDTNQVQPLLNSLLTRQVDGILWAVPEVGSNRRWLQDELPRLSVPVVFLTMEARPDLSVVSVDNYAGARLATAHLLEQGYRHIGHIAGPLDWWESRQRKAGWQDTLAAAGISAVDYSWDEGDWSAASGSRAFCRLLERYPAMEAVFVGNDQMALGLLQVACQKGIKVPRDLAVVGFDSIPEAAHYWPPLTTVDQRQEELGEIAVQELVRIIEAHRQNGIVQPRAIVLEPRLVIRGSSRPLPPDGLTSEACAEVQSSG